MTKIEKLQLRAKAGLSNENEIIVSELQFALDEATEIVGDKNLAEAYLIDIAYYRFLLLMKIGVDESEVANYKIALKAFDLAPVIVIEDGVESDSFASKVIVSNRESVI